MARKPTLKIVPATPSTGTEPPATLGEYGKTLWGRVMAEYDLVDSAGQEMLRQACAALDRAEACAAHITTDGEVVHTRTGVKDHPALKHELAKRAFVCRTL